MTKVFGVLCSNGFREFDSHTTTKKYKIMKFTYTHITENTTEITEYKVNKINKIKVKKYKK